MQHARNELKRKILLYLKRNKQGRTSAQIAKGIGAKVENVRFILSYYIMMRAGIFKRVKSKNREYTYYITGKGLQELQGR